MGFAGRNRLGLMGGLAVLAAATGMAAGQIAEPVARRADPQEPRRAPAPAGGRTYKPNGSREVNRRQRQAERSKKD